MYTTTYEDSVRSFVKDGYNNTWGNQHMSILQLLK